jgi:hypothetical protein
MKPASISGIKRQYVKDKINELAMNSTNMNIRNISLWG